MQTQTTPAAALRGAVKNYPGFTLGPVDLTVPRGCIVGLIGENGAGKTTLLKLLTGVNRADGGSVQLLGGSPQDASARKALGVVFEDSFFHESFTPTQVGRCLAGVYGTGWDAPLFAQLLKSFGLGDDKPLRASSRGMCLKAQLAAALAHHPRLLVLDEATSGLDPVMRSDLLDQLLGFIQDEDCSVLMSSHITDDLAQVADSIAYLHGGKLLFQEDKDVILEEYGILRCSAADAARLPEQLRVHTRQSQFGAETLVKGRRAVQRILPNAIVDAASLDDIMRFYTGRDQQ